MDKPTVNTNHSPLAPEGEKGKGGTEWGKRGRKRCLLLQISFLTFAKGRGGKEGIGKRGGERTLGVRKTLIGEGGKKGSVGGRKR